MDVNIPATVSNPFEGDREMYGMTQSVPAASAINSMVAIVYQGNVAAGWWTDLQTGESLVGKDPVDQPHVERFLRGGGQVGHDHEPCPVRPDDPGQPADAVGCGQDAELGLWKSIARARRGEAEIAR